MRVKRLEIQGFKSFKDKTVIHFDHGITGIVGPNGCGKSNIVDAFFWVMGEQSYKHMRGSSSEDLIFNGSSKYDPLGMAEATLVLETDAVDTDHGVQPPAGATQHDIPIHLRAKEVAVTRRVYRDGQGEYFINGVTARLKDIQELFMDTGVGAKGYSIIEQGQIGKIVNAKPEERRLLVEEAAGIAKYKARKKESIRKMEAAQANLSRLNDVVQEIERSLNSLERQAQKARQYRKFKDELVDKEMTWGRRKAQVLRQKLEALRAKRDAMDQELVALKAQLSTTENSIEGDQIAQISDTQAAEELQSRIQQNSDELAEVRGALELARRRRSDLAAQKDTLETEKFGLLSSIENEMARVRACESETSQWDESFSSAAKRAQAMDEEVRRLRQEAEGMRQKLEGAKRQLIADVSRASDISARSAALAMREENARAESARLNDQLTSQNEKIEAAREEMSTARGDAASLREKRAALKTESQNQAAEIQSQDLKLKTLDRDRELTLRSFTEFSSRLQSLKELAAAHEGFGDGPKSALDWAKTTGATDRLIAMADAIQVKPGFEPAVEGWLESRLECLIASDTQLALNAIDHVLAQKQGRLSISIPLSAETEEREIAGFVSFESLRETLEAAGFTVHGRLDQFAITQNPTATKILADVCVVEDFSAIAALTGRAGPSKLGQWGLVSIDGKALDSDGTLRGGTTASMASGEGATSLLRHRRAITELSLQSGEAEARYQLAENTANDARQQLQLMRNRQALLQSEIQSLEVQSAALDRDIHQMNRSIQDAEAAHERLQNDLTRAQEQLESAAVERSALQSELAETLSRRTELEKGIGDLDTELSAKDTEVRAQEVELQSLRVSEASLRERAVSLKRELEGARSLVADRERRVTEIDRALERANREHDQFTGGESQQESRVEELTLVLAEQRDRLSEIKNRLEQLASKINVNLDRIKELHREGDERTADLSQLAIEAEKISGDLSHLIQNLEEKYGPGCLEKPVASPIQEEMTEPVVTLEMTAEEEAILSQEVEQLRERIRRLGEVNPNAVEEFEELKKRHDHLLTEKGDLEQSIENLEEAIEHINRTSEERFRRAFDAIADRFERLFPIIFGGGQAKLSLVYPEGSSDILDAGVEILAQPPGKKIVNIGLLSGGEKALTAVSLIFAIFMIKPSPFCVLDEVDAPLDDANVGKFNALLREMSGKSQFILITHNKKTMELNDTLYGVTMEEPGVSKMVSIEMR